MLPSPPFPYRPAFLGHFQEVVVPYPAIHFGSWPSALDSRGYVLRQFGGTQKECVTVLQQSSIMVMIRVTNLPKNPPVPVHFQGRATHKRRLPQKSLVGNSSVVKESAPLGQVPVEAGRVWHVPGMDQLAVEIDQVNRPVAGHRGE